MNDSEHSDVRVLYVEGAAEEPGVLPAVLTDEDSVSVDRVVGIETALTAIETAGSVDCLVIACDLEDAIDVVSAARESDPDLPIVLFPLEPAPGAAGEALRAGATDYLPRTVDGHETMLSSVVRDAADEYADRRTRRQESERYRALMETMPMSIYFKDEEARFVDISEWSKETIDEPMIGRTDVDIWGDVRGVPAVESYEDDLQVVETGEPLVDNDRHHEIGGVSNWQRKTKMPWRNEDGEVVGLVGITVDITGFEERERELQKRVRQLEGFASFVSHDLRNPIMIANGYLQLARETDDPGDHEAALDDVEIALERMEELVEDLLAMVRSEETDVAADGVDLPTLVDDVWGVLDTGTASLRNEVPTGTTIEAVEGQLRQLLSNLFWNALEHVGPDVEVVVGLSDEGFYVADDGQGLDVEDPDVVFEYGHTRGGTGVGLAIVREIAEAHDWTVSAGESGRSGGTRFNVDGCLLQTPVQQYATRGDPVQLSASTDIGDVTPAGESTFDTDRNVWSLTGGGRDVWEDIDEHHFAYATVDPPVRVVATVHDFDTVHEFSKAGVMIRDDPTAGSPLGFVGLLPQHGTEFGWRSDPEDRIRTRPSWEYAGASQRYRLDFLDSRVTGYVSTDDGWKVVDQQPVRATGSVAAGLAVCSHARDKTCEAVFEDVRIVELQPEPELESH